MLPVQRLREGEEEETRAGNELKDNGVQTRLRDSFVKRLRGNTTREAKGAHSMGSSLGPRTQAEQKPEANPVIPGPPYGEDRIPREVGKAHEDPNPRGLL